MPARAAEARRRAEQTPATTARDHYLLATSLARQGGPERLRAAIAELDEALQLNPRHYWSLVQRGICRLERGELVEAAADFGQCTGLWPEFAWGYFNRGCVLDRAGNKAAAILDYTAALERDPGLVPAHVNRGLARLELKQDAAALADFDQAGALGGGARGLRRARRRPGGAGPARRGRLPLSPTASRRPAACAPRPALGWPGLMASPSPPATREGPRGLRRGPAARPARCPRRSTACAMLAMARGEDATALRDFDRALEADPGQIEARRYRAIVLARRGDWDAATREINRAWSASPGHRRRSTRPPASSPGRTAALGTAATAAPGARPPRAGAGRGSRPARPPTTPTSPRSGVSRGSIALSAHGGRP